MAIRTDSAADSIERTANLPATTDDMTIMCWVRNEVQAAWRLIFQVGSSFDDSLTHWLGCEPNDTLNFFTAGGSGSTGSVLTDSAWHHITMRVIGTGVAQVEIYLDGVLDITADGANQAIGVLRIGNDLLSEFWDGRYAALKIWDTALSADEIEAEMSTYFPQRIQNCIGFYPLFDNSSKSEIDRMSDGAALTYAGTIGTEDGPPVSWRPSSGMIAIPSAAGPTTTTTTTTTSTTSSSTTSSSTTSSSTTSSTTSSSTTSSSTTSSSTTSSSTTSSSTTSSSTTSSTTTTITFLGTTTSSSTTSSSTTSSSTTSSSTTSSTTSSSTTSSSTTSSSTTSSSTTSSSTTSSSTTSSSTTSSTTSSSTTSSSTTSSSTTSSSTTSSSTASSTTSSSTTSSTTSSSTTSTSTTTFTGTTTTITLSPNLIDSSRIRFVGPEHRIREADERQIREV